VRPKPSAKLFREWNSRTRRALERWPAGVDQIIADVPGELVLRCFRQRERLVDGFLFRTL
jgi:hypothetical protein